MPSRRTNNFPESGRGLGHVTPTIFGSTVGYPSDSLASCQFYKEYQTGKLRDILECIFVPKLSEYGIILQSYCTNKKGAIFLCPTVYVCKTIVAGPLSAPYQVYRVINSLLTYL